MRAGGNGLFFPTLLLARIFSHQAVPRAEEARRQAGRDDRSKGS